MKITVEFEIDNAAFVDALDTELGYVLRQVVRRTFVQSATLLSVDAKSDETHRLQDSNGNTVGHIRFVS